MAKDVFYKASDGTTLWSDNFIDYYDNDSCPNVHLIRDGDVFKDIEHNKIYKINGKMIYLREDHGVGVTGPYIWYKNET